MTELQLYKFIKVNYIEWNKTNDGKDIIIFLSFYKLESFTEMLSRTHFDDGGINIVLMKNYVCIHMKDICEYYGIELENIFIND